jgi:hypothetical protein
MQEKIKHITANGIEYPLVFNLNVMEAIQEKYETLEKWGELTDGKEREVDIKALKFGITEMINEGIDIENENNEVKRNFLTEKQVGRIVTDIGVEKLSTDVQKTVIDSTKPDNEPKNE